MGYRVIQRKTGALVLILMLAFASLFSRSFNQVVAHAYLLRSDPSADAVLAKAPSRVTIWFSESPQAGFSSIEVFNPKLSQIDLRNSAVNADQIGVDLPTTLPNGTYTVRWSALSATDGHHTTGVFVFAVGEAISPMASEQLTPTATSADPIDAVVKWFNIFSLTVLCGTMLISIVVLGPVFGEHGIKGQISEAISWLIYAALIASLFGAAISLIIQMLTLYPANLLILAGLKPWVDVLTQTRYGSILLVRLALTGLLMVWLAQGQANQITVIRVWAVGLLLTFGLLLTLSLNSHSAASALWSDLSLGIDWLHLIGVSAWVGGLLILAVLLPMLSRTQRYDALTRFSALATLSIAVLTVTGLYSTALHLYRFEDLWGSEYGRWLLLKLGVVAVMLLLGLLNNLSLNSKRLKQIRFLPALQRQSLARRDAAEDVQSRVLIESLLGIGVLLTVGFLTVSSPPPVPPLTVDRTLTQTRIEGDLIVSLHIMPNVVGQNTYTVQVRQADRLLTTLTQVRVQFVLPVLALRTPWLTLKANADGTYETPGRELSVLGEWQILLDVQTSSDSNAIRLVYPWTVSAATLGPDLSQPRPVNTLMLALLSTALVLIGWPRVLNTLRGKYGKRLKVAAITLIGLSVIGVLIVILVSMYRQSEAAAGLPTVNPIPADMASIVKGQTTYQQLCIGCHGAQGLGDGVNANSVKVLPANLRVHVPQHEDAMLYQMIAQGYGVMPAIGAGLSPDERWNLVNYLRTLGADTISLK